MAKPSESNRRVVDGKVQYGLLVERPLAPAALVFPDPEVRAIRAGRKTQDRRVIRLPAPNHMLGQWEVITVGGPGVHDDAGNPTPATPAVYHTRTGRVIACPWRCGDRIAVKETWQSIGWDGFTWVVTVEGTRAVYRADGGDLPDPYESNPRWRSPIHMPSWAVRTTLEVTGVRAQFLQQITREDAVASGAFFTDYGQHEHAVSGDGGKTWGATHTQRAGWSLVETNGHEHCLGSPEQAFGNRWNVVHGGERWNLTGKREPWDENPLVWALTFKLVEQAT